VGSGFKSQGVHHVKRVQALEQPNTIRLRLGLKEP